jgi:hypothetical protein
MELSILHSFFGDKEIDFDTESQEGRKKLSETLNKLLRSGTAIFLERADKTYRVTGWDPETDKLLIQNPGRWPVGEARHLEGEAIDAEVVTAPPQLPEHAGETERQPSSRKGKKHGPYVRAGTRRGRMTAVAPTSGG